MDANYIDQNSCIKCVFNNGEYSNMVFGGMKGKTTGLTPEE